MEFGHGDGFHVLSITGNPLKVLSELLVQVMKTLQLS